LPTTARGATEATSDSCVVVKGVGLAEGCIYNAAENPGSTLFGSAIFKPL
jgi:hypothetical protein